MKSKKAHFCSGDVIIYDGIPNGEKNKRLGIIIRPSMQKDGFRHQREIYLILVGVKKFFCHESYFEQL